MTQINLIQDTVMILDEVNLMDSNRERLIIYNLKEIEQHLDILDEIERGTAIASERADALSAKIKKLSLKPATEPVHIVMKLDNKLDTLMAIEQSTNAAIHKTERMNEKVLGRTQEKENKCSGLIPDKDAEAEHLEEVCNEIVKMEQKLELLDAVRIATALDLDRSHQMQVKIKLAELRSQHLTEKPSLTSSNKKMSDPQVHKDEIPDKDVEAEHLEEVSNEIVKMEQKSELLDAVRIATALDLDRSHQMQVKIKHAELRSQNLTDKPSLTSSNQKVSDPQVHVDEIFKAISTIEGKLNLLEKLYNDLKILKGQTEILNDGIQKFEKTKADAQSINQPLEHASEVSCDSQQVIEPLPIASKAVQHSQISGNGKEHLHEIHESMSVIEARLNELEMMYSDIKNLRGQAEVLNDKLQHAQQKPVQTAPIAVQSAPTFSTYSAIKSHHEEIKILKGQTEILNNGIQKFEETKADAQSINQPLELTSEISYDSQQVNEPLPIASKAVQHSQISGCGKEHLHEIQGPMSVIEARLNELEMMYSDIKNLRGQAEVLNDKLEHAQKKPVQTAPIVVQSAPAFSTYSAIESHHEEIKTDHEMDLEKSQVLSILTELDKIERQLSILQSIEKATVLDVERSEELVSKLSLVEKFQSGTSMASTNLNLDLNHDFEEEEAMPMDTHECLAAIEKRLSVIEDLRREKHIQSELTDDLIQKIRDLEIKLVWKMCDQPQKQSDKESDVSILFAMMSMIEQKLRKLEKLYGEVDLLHSQAHILGDKMQEYEIAQRKRNEQLKTMQHDAKLPPASIENANGQMENIAILEKEISELIKGSELSKFDSRLDSMDEWEVVDKPSIQMEMQPDPQQFMSSADFAKMKIGDLQRSYSAETTELMAKVDGIKESVKEQEALRLLERENSLEFLDFGGTGGPVEQEAALLLERVDQGFTQIITDQSESHLMTSLKKELTPEKLESDTSLEEHERERMHQPQLMRQILEMQRMQDMEDEDENQFPTFPMMQQQGLDDSMKSDEQIAAELHQLRLEKDQQVKMQDTKVNRIYKRIA